MRNVRIRVHVASSTSLFSEHVQVKVVLFPASVKETSVLAIDYVKQFLQSTRYHHHKIKTTLLDLLEVVLHIKVT